MNFYDEYVRMVEEYNSGSLNVEEFFRQLTDLVRELSVEEQRHISENLSEEDLTIFDLLTKPDLHLTEKEKTQVKKVSQELLETLKKEKLQLDWHKKRQLRAAVRLTIIDKLEELPEAFTPEIYDQKCELVYQHIFNSYFGEGKSVFATGSA